ncbi:MAG: hypothetical protein CMQ20_15960 [Gammaproteobacteria bacterium]|nr:hypothetical protein [Gammaproteobacteria bacterium]
MTNFLLPPYAATDSRPLVDKLIMDRLDRCECAAAPVKPVVLPVLLLGWLIGKDTRMYKLVLASVILLAVQGCSTMGMVARDDVHRTYVGEGTQGYYIEPAEVKFENKLKQIQKVTWLRSAKPLDLSLGEYRK